MGALSRIRGFSQDFIEGGATTPRPAIISLPGKARLRAAGACAWHGGHRAAGGGGARHVKSSQLPVGIFSEAVTSI